MLEQLEHDLIEVNTNKDALKKNYLELQELRHILIKATTFFEEVIFWLVDNFKQANLDFFFIIILARPNSKR